MLRIIELFAGIGSQHQALKNIGVPHEVTAISEWEVAAVKSYKALHCESNNADYSTGMSKSEVVDALYDLQISTDGKEPLTFKQIASRREKWLRDTYNTFRATKNAGSITKIERLPQADLWTYSFPCQDLSVAGKQAGIKHGSRSGLLYEVERLLGAAKADGTQPKYLLMENVKNLVGSRHKKDFNKWIDFLNGMGYWTYWKVLNAKDYGIPQNRERVFAVSIYGEGYYKFPPKQPLKLRLKDMLEDEVDAKYYLSKQAIEGMMSSGFNQDKPTIGGGGGTPYLNRNGLQACAICNTIRTGGRGSTDGKHIWDIVMKELICVGMLGGEIYGKMNESSRRVYDAEGIAPTINTVGGG